MKIIYAIAALAALSACAQNLDRCTHPELYAAGFTKQHATKDNACVRPGMKLGEGVVEAAIVGGVIVAVAQSPWAAGL